MKCMRIDDKFDCPNNQALNEITLKTTTNKYIFQLYHRHTNHFTNKQQRVNAYIKQKNAVLFSRNFKLNLFYLGFTLVQGKFSLKFETKSFPPSPANSISEQFNLGKINHFKHFSVVQWCSIECMNSFIRGRWRLVRFKFQNRLLIVMQLGVCVRVCILS